MFRLTAIVLAFILFYSACNPLKDTHSPQVTPEIVKIGAGSVTLKWNNVGEQYSYGVMLAYDSIQDADFRNVGSIYKTNDTMYTVDSLISDAWYKVKVRTYGGNLSPNESWPPLRFKTK